MVIIFFDSESESVLKATIKMIDISSFQLRTGPMKIECDFNILDENLFRSCQILKNLQNDKWVYIDPFRTSFYST